MTGFDETAMAQHRPSNHRLADARTPPGGWRDRARAVRAPGNGGEDAGATAIRE